MANLLCHLESDQRQFGKPTRVTKFDPWYYEACAAELRVLETTPQTPGLPYITGLAQDSGAVFNAVSRAIDALGDDDRRALGIRQLVTIPTEAYLAVANPD